MKNLFKSEKGFTLIELLVVIAIIGILSSIVLASLNTARSKGNDAKTKAQLSGMRSAAEVYYDTNGSYGTAVGNEAAGAGKFDQGCDTSMFTDPVMDVYTSTASYPAGVNMKCTAGLIGSVPAYAVSATLSSANTVWCVDSSGASRLTTTGAVQADSAYVCP